jgi:hypothetical protein
MESATNPQRSTDVASRPSKKEGRARGPAQSQNAPPLNPWEMTQLTRKAHEGVATFSQDGRARQRCGPPYNKSFPIQCLRVFCSDFVTAAPNRAGTGISGGIIRRGLHLSRQEARGRGCPSTQNEPCNNYGVINTLVCLFDHTQTPSIINDLTLAAPGTEICARGSSGGAGLVLYVYISTYNMTCTKCST